MVTIFVPPAVFQEVQAVFNLPMTANITQQISRRNLRRVETGNKITHIMRDNLSTRSAQLAINAQRDLTTRQVERLTNVIGVV